MSPSSRIDDTPPGFKLRHRLLGHRQRIHYIAWSPNGKLIASGGEDDIIRLWNTQTGKPLEPLVGHSGAIYSLAWSSDGQTLASGSGDGNIHIWAVKTGRLWRTLAGSGGPVYSLVWSRSAHILASGSHDQTIRFWDTINWRLLHVLTGHTGPVYSVAWSPDEGTLASGSSDCSIRLWDGVTGLARQELKVHFGAVYSVAWSRDEILASGSRDQTIRLWHPKKRMATQVLEGHTDAICSVAFSSDGRLLASQCHDGTIGIWNPVTCDQIESIAEEVDNITPFWLEEPRKNLAFHPSPSSHELATLFADDKGIKLWELNFDRIATSVKPPGTIHYANAKVVLVGQSGVGKTGLALVMMGESFRPTDSTHGRYVWPFDTQERELDNRVVEYETLLWDLAGQPGYRVFHQLHLNEVAVALVVFDAGGEIDPFPGVAYWARALDVATRGFPLVKFLVAARVDRSEVTVSQTQIDKMLARYGFKAFFKTSARRGEGINDLVNAIRAAIAWDQMDAVSMPQLFRDMKQFVVDEKEAGRILQPRSRLLERYRQIRRALDAPAEVFDTCLGRLEAVGLIRRLSFRSLVLLQPEILDNYCAWLAQAAQAELYGLGYIPEQTALSGGFKMDTDRLLANRSAREIERYILLATVQEVVDRSIARREVTERGVMLVFPSEMRTDMPEYLGEYIRAVAFQFEGPISAIYATLAVRLINSREFNKKDLYRNAAIFLDPNEQICGFVIDHPDARDDGLGRLTVFFAPDAEKENKLLLLRYVNQQLEKLALSVQRERVYQCSCRYIIPTEVIVRRKQFSKMTVRCPVCDNDMPIDDLAEQSTHRDERIDAIEANANAEQQRQKRVLVLRERELNHEYHVFLCHNSLDRAEVRQLAEKLRDQGILPWIDEHDLLVATPFALASELERVFASAPAMAVVFGAHALGPQHAQEYYASLIRFIEQSKRQGRSRSRSPFPVLLPDVPKQPEQLPPWLRTLNAIDFRQEDGMANHDQMNRLIQAILRGSY
jgi:WD40 repeat protein